MIVTDKYKSYSLFTFEELQESINQDIENMSEVERAVFFEMLNNPHLESDLTALELDREMVSVEQWIEDEYYMGGIGKSIYKPWKDDLIELFDSGQYDTAIIQGGIGCVSSTTLVQMSDGALERIGDLANTTRRVLAYDKEQIAIGVHNGIKQLYEIKFRNGMSVKATAEHKFMTQDGWVRTDRLDVAKHKIKSPRITKTEPSEHSLSIEPTELLGVLLSSYRTVQRFEGYLIAKHDKEKIELIEKMLMSQGINFNKESPYTLYVIDDEKLKSYFAQFELTALQKTFIPKKVLRSSNDILAAFLRGYSISCSINNKHEHMSRVNYAISYLCSNKAIAEEITLALRRFGIRSKLYLGSQGADKPKRYHVEISSKPSLSRFCSDISFLNPSSKVEFENALLLMDAKQNRSRVDFIPITYADLIAWCKKHKCPIWRQKSYWNAPKTKNLYVSYREVENIISEFPHMIVHAWEIQFDPDSYWDDIVSITEAGYEDVYDLVVPNDNCYLSNGVLCHNSGKSTFSHLVVLRMLYEASCLKNPAVSYGLSANSVIGFCSLAKSKETARRVVFDQIAAKIQESPYFKYDFAPLKPLKDEIVFPKGLAIICGSSTDTSIIGMNIFGGIIDEVNFWGKVKKSSASFTKNWGTESKSGRLFDSVRRRMKSRYVKKGKLPGIIMLISSKTTKDSLTEQFIRKEQALGNNSTFVRDRSILEMKRGSFSTKTFRVLIGTTDYVSRILAENESVDGLKEPMIIEIPEDFRVDFENNLEESLRDIAGVSTLAISNFISKVEKINEIIDTERAHPFTCPFMPDSSTWDSRHSYHINWDALCVRHDNGEWRPRINPDAPRHVHFDPGYTGDSFGLCIAHVGGQIPIASSGDIIEYKPMFIVDFILEIKGSKDEEVLNSNVRNLCYEFSSHGFHLAEFSTDSYQCFAGDTKVKLLDGRNLTMVELAHEFGLDKEFWVYSFDGEKIVPGLARNARKNGFRQTITIELDNGEKVRCTDDHLWMMRDGTYKHAKDLTTEDSLMPLYTRTSTARSSAAMEGYEEIYQPMNNKWELTHRVVGKHLWQNTKGKYIHHAGICNCGNCVVSNYCKLNNDPSSLQLVSKKEHSRLHSDICKNNSKKYWEYYHSLPDDSDEKNRLKKFFRERLAKTRNRKDVKEKLANIGSERLKKINDIRYSDPLVRQKLRERAIEWNKNHKGRNHYKWKEIKLEDVIAAIDTEGSFAKASIKLGINRNSLREKLKKDFNVTPSDLMKKNHKIISITKGIIEDVYDIEVDKHHNFALSSGVFVHNSREMIQQLEQQGFKAGMYSVDTGISSRGENVVNDAVGKIPKSKQAYWYLRSAIYENRLKCYDYPKVFGELRRLEDGPDKIDHPEGESKDLADALCGVIWTLFRARYTGDALTMMPTKGITDSPNVVGETLLDFQESVAGKVYDKRSHHEPEKTDIVKTTKVYQKKKPLTIAPSYKKVSANGDVTDLRRDDIDVEAYIQRG